jgi:triacylglycerol lipase
VRSLVFVVAGVLMVCASARASTPVVLVPGFMGVRESGVSPSYFPTLKAALKGAGADVTEIAPPPLADSDVRGAFLASQIEAVCARTGAAKVVVIAHSQGGIDVRAALALGAASHVAAVATIASPHHGTGVADTALTWPMPAVRVALNALAIVWRLGQGDNIGDLDVDGALAMLSTKGMASFAARHGESGGDRVHGVPFFTIADVTARRATRGSCDGGMWSAPRVKDQMHPMLVFGAAMIKNALGDVDNDGVVPTASMHYARFLGCAPADHVDWEGLDRYRGPFDAPAFTVELWRGLEDVARTDDVDAMDAHVPMLAALAFAIPR